MCIMMYADDIVLLADNENDLQSMLNLLDNWCSVNNLVINAIKSKIVHFRPRLVLRTNFAFSYGSTELKIADRYVYLGITLHEFLDFNVTAKMVCQAASRALGLLIAKYKTLEGMPFDVHGKLYDAMVWPVIAYGAAVWEDRSYFCIKAVLNREMKFFLRVGHIRRVQGLLVIWIGFLP